MRTPANLSRMARKELEAFARAAVLRNEELERRVAEDERQFEPAAVEGLQGQCAAFRTDRAAQGQSRTQGLSSGPERKSRQDRARDGEAVQSLPGRTRRGQSDVRLRLGQDR